MADGKAGRWGSRSGWPTRVSGMRQRQSDREFLRRANFINKPANPLRDPLAHLRPPRRESEGRRRAPRRVEFESWDVQQIRATFGATQAQFARLIGISRETLRNWERGRRRPTGPARALLRAIDADPVALGRALHYYRRAAKAVSMDAAPERPMDAAHAPQGPREPTAPHGPHGLHGPREPTTPRD